MVRARPAATPAPCLREIPAAARAGSAAADRRLALRNAVAFRFRRGGWRFRIRGGGRDRRSIRDRIAAALRPLPSPERAAPAAVAPEILLRRRAGRSSASAPAQRRRV